MAPVTEQQLLAIVARGQIQVNIVNRTLQTTPTDNLLAAYSSVFDSLKSLADANRELQVALESDTNLSPAQVEHFGQIFNANTQYIGEKTAIIRGEIRKGVKKHRTRDFFVAFRDCPNLRKRVLDLAGLAEVLGGPNEEKGGEGEGMKRGKGKGKRKGKGKGKRKDKAKK